MPGCTQCGSDEYTIRGLCAKCAPELHAAYAAAMGWIEEAETKFEQTTGKTALANWNEFEDFYSSRPELANEIVRLHETYQAPVLVITKPDEPC